MKRTLTLIIATIAAATLVASSFGQGAGPAGKPGPGGPGGPGGQRGQGGRGGRMGNMDTPILEKLKLTADQKKNVKALKDKMAKTMKETMEKNKGGDRSAMRDTFMKMMKDYRTSLEKLLTPTQWAEYQKEMKEMRKKMGGPGGPGGPGGEGRPGGAGAPGAPKKGKGGL